VHVVDASMHVTTLASTKLASAQPNVQRIALYIQQPSSVKFVSSGYERMGLGPKKMNKE
jgi:hypothetical protein